MWGRHLRVRCDTTVMLGLARVWWCAVVVVMSTSTWARELDPGACAARFDVQRDKIIRTEESRDMGARYLSELDVGSRQECRRLCCETDACDVFVYEEKSPGSCYLFNCGPPEDFRCKFTAHGNFSSGVMQLSRRLAELQDQERLAHRASQLTGRGSATSSTLPPPPLPPRALDSRPPTQPYEERSRGLAPPAAVAAAPLFHCSRYQFACHSGGECIAVYNACDGVPQCADGSDEAPELGCPQPQPQPPTARPTVPTTLPSTRPPPPSPLESEEGSETRVSEVGESRWPSRLAQALPPRRRAEGGGSHIFSHKGGLVQEADPPLSQYPAFEPPAPAPMQPWPRRPWPQQTGMEGMTMGGVWGGNGGAGGYLRGEWEGERRAWPVPPPRMEPELPVYLPPKTMPEMPMVYAAQQHTLRDAPKKGLGLEPPPQLPGVPVGPPAALPSPPAPVVTSSPHEDVKPQHVENTTKKKVLEKTAETPQEVQAHAHGAEAQGGGGAVAGDASVTRVRLAGAGERDGLSERPPAAVLLLVLGLCMTGVLGAVVTVRARAARRRRRGKSPLAHDPDYLVNGMYL